jgi:hypothetical protein
MISICYFFTKHKKTLGEGIPDKKMTIQTKKMKGLINYCFSLICFLFVIDLKSAINTDFT